VGLPRNAPNIREVTTENTRQRPKTVPGREQRATPPAAKKRTVAGQRSAVAGQGGEDAAGAVSVARRPWDRKRSVVVVTLLVLVGAVLMAAAALAYIKVTPKTYSAESLVIILSQSGSNGDVGSITAAWVEIAHAPTVLAGAADSLGVQVGDLEKALTVSQPQSTPLVSIKMVTTDATRSASWANAVADQLLLQADQRPISGFKLNQLTRAVPARQADPDQSSLLLVGATAVGALLGGVAGTSLVGRRRES
jgi:capsular polysaccharide biosynthesis protein